MFLIFVLIMMHRNSIFSSYQIDIASAGEYLHSLTPAIIHRDLKTHNILRATNGSYKICDFGLVKNKNITAGTPAYMAPGKMLEIPILQVAINPTIFPHRIIGQQGL